MANLKLDSEKDRLFEDASIRTANFKFDASVVHGFHDMVSRSVPFYGEMQRMTTELDQSVDPGVSFLGVDSSDEMLLTLQFVRPLDRERIMRRMCEGMVANGCLILIEKCYDHKRRNGYSNTEIATKGRHWRTW